jgi:hypothetical protein
MVAVVQRLLARGGDDGVGYLDTVRRRKVDRTTLRSGVARILWR